MSITNCNCMKINTAQIISDCSFVQYFSMRLLLSVFCNHQPHTRSKPIDGVNIVELGISKLLLFEKRFVSIQALLRHNEYRKAKYKKKVMLPAKKPLNALCEKRLQFSMFKWTSFYNFLEFHCKILNSYAIYRCKKMVKILNCYLYAKKLWHFV